MTLQYQNFRPQCSIKVFTQTGDIYDLTGDIISWQTQKSLTQPQGTFAIQLADTKHAGGKDWTAFVSPMDYVEIRASATGTKTSQGVLPIIMRGFTDVISHSMSLGQTG